MLSLAVHVRHELSCQTKEKSLNVVVLWLNGVDGGQTLKHFREVALFLQKTGA